MKWIQLVFTKIVITFILILTIPIHILVIITLLIYGQTPRQIINAYKEGIAKL